MQGTTGEIGIFAGNFAPRGWSLCQGQLLAISNYSSLFSILGTTYGGDGRTSFALPDFRGRIPIDAGQGAGLTNRLLGQRGGTETQAITQAQMPAHSHSFNVSAVIYPIGDNDTSSSYSTNTPEGNYFGAGTDMYYHQNNTTMGPTSFDLNLTGAQIEIGSTGGISSSSSSGNGSNGNEEKGYAFSIIQPYVVLNYIICSTGLYPSRN